MPSCFKLVQLLSVRNIKELNNLGKYLLLAEKIRNTVSFHFFSYYCITWEQDKKPPNKDEK